MSTRRWMAGAVLSVVLSASPSAWAWRPRPVDELQLMREPELVKKAWDTCRHVRFALRMAAGNVPGMRSVAAQEQALADVARALDYLETLGLVVRARSQLANPSIEVKLLPMWYEEFFAATSAPAPDDGPCDAVWERHKPK